MPTSRSKMECGKLSSVISRNNVHIRGKGDRAMVFAHGFGCDQDIWRFVAPSFERDFVTVLFDHVGAGRSQLSAYSSEKYSTLQGYADDVVELGRELDLENAVYVGHSTGAMIGVLATIQSQHMFNDLVMISPSPCYINDDDYTGGFSHSQVDDMLSALSSDYAVWTSRMAPLFMGNSARPELSDELLHYFQRTDPNIAKDFARAKFRSDVRDALPLVKTRSLILQNGHDWMAPTSVGQYMHQRMAGSELLKMNTEGHFPQLSAPSEIVAALSNFLKGSTLRSGLAKFGPRNLVTLQDAPLSANGEQHESQDCLLSRTGELQLALGRYDMYALSLQQLLEETVGSVSPEVFTLRSRGAEIIRLMEMMPAATRAHFVITDFEVHKLLARHEISASRGAAIPGLAVAANANCGGPNESSRDWFDQSHCSTADLRRALEVVERDILKLVALSLRVSSCALAVMHESTKHA